MKILITGASGFLGKSITLNLLNSNDVKYQLALLVKKTSNLDVFSQFFERLTLGKCNSEDEVSEFVKLVRPDILIHTANSYGRANEDYLLVQDTNIRLGLTLIKAVENLNKDVLFINAGTALPSNLSWYALSKNQFIEWGRAISETNERFNFVNVKLQHMYGPGDSEAKFTTYVIRSCLNNKDKLDLTAGYQLRDFIFIDDVIRAYRLLINNSQDFKGFNEFELGSGEVVSIREYVELVHKLTKSKSVLNFGALSIRHGEPMYSKADISKFKKMGWMPLTSFEDGLRRTIKMELLR